MHLDHIEAATDLPRAQIDANIEFLRWATGLAKQLGIQTHLITWNIHVPPSFAEARGIEAKGVDTPEVREYVREAVRAVIDTYPDLTTVGTCPGESMPMGAQERQDWIADTHMAGARRASRGVPFFLRYWQGDPVATAAMLDREAWPEPVYLAVKFNGEHMVSSPRPHLLDRRWLDMAQDRWKVFWHLRNDCLFRLKWGDPEFVRETVRNCRTDYSCGFFWGSEGLKPGADGVHQPQSQDYATYDYEFQRKSEMYRLWGMLGYDPSTPDGVLFVDYRRALGEAAPDAIEALKQASRIIPLVTSFHWNYMNGDWQPEHNIGDWNTNHEASIHNWRDKEAFHSVKEFIWNHTIDDSLMSIPDAVALSAAGDPVPLPMARRLPEHVAHELISTAEAASHAIALARERLPAPDPHFECLRDDVLLHAELGRYYGWKILAATELGHLLITGDEQSRGDAIDYLTKCRAHWQTVCDLAARQYPTSRWRDQLPRVEADIEYARAVTPIPTESIAWQVAPASAQFDGADALHEAQWREVELTRLIEKGEGQGLTEWLERINATPSFEQCDLRAVVGEASPAYMAQRTLTIEESGSVDLVVEAPAGTLLLNGRPLGTFGPADGGSHYFTAPVEEGEATVLAHILAQEGQAPFGLRVSLLPVRDVVVRFECEEAEVEEPMTVVRDPGCSGGAYVYAPRDAGRGDDAEGTPIDNGRMSFRLDLDRPGKVDVWVRVFWPATTANSYFIGMEDDGDFFQFGQDEDFGRWHWVKARAAYALPAGEHTLTLRTREVDTRGDVVVIAKTPVER